MSPRNLLSTLLASVLVLNASCACAALEANPAQSDHAAHHQQTAVEPADQDCQLPDCNQSCARAGNFSDRESVNLPTFKLDLDWDGLLGADIHILAFESRITSTGPPGNLSISRASTPVRRFDLQRK